MKVPIELKIRYLSRRLDDVQQVKLTLDQEDFSLAIKVGHQIKGNAATFEVPQIAFIGFEMERAAIKKDKEKVMILIDRMETLIHSAQLRH